MTRFVIAGFLTLLLMTPAANAHGDDDLWIHVAVDGGEDAERVRVNVPLSLVEVVLPLIEEDELSGGKIRLDGTDMEREDILAMLHAVDGAAEGEYVTVEDGDDFVRVAKEGEHILVNVADSDGGGKEQVNIRVPVEILRALLSGDGDELDVLAAVQSLGKHEGGDLVTVSEDDGTTVRIWIDDQNASE